MDSKILTLQNMLSLISSDMEKLSEEIREYADKKDIEQSFDDISKMVNKNRRMILRARQYAAEISSLIEESPM